VTPRQPQMSSRSTTWVRGLGGVVGTVSTALSLVGAVAGLGLPGRSQATGVALRPQHVPASESEGGAWGRLFQRSGNLDAR
jgi:hypothetical protein